LFPRIAKIADAELGFPTEATFGFDPLLPPSLRSHGRKYTIMYQVDSNGEVVGAEVTG
jgi:hypothetical protein